MITRTYYDDAGRTQFVVANLVGQAISVGTPPNGCNETGPDENVCTAYAYDDASRQIAVTDPNGIITRTYYDGLGRTQYVVRNLVGQGISVGTPPNGCNETAPDENVCTQFTYDGAAGPDRRDRSQLGDYPHLLRRAAPDTDRRPEPDRADDLQPHPPTFNPANPDQNVRTDTVYGDGGEVVRIVDTLSHATVSCYDGQYRVVKTVQNPTVGGPVRLLHAKLRARRGHHDARDLRRSGEPGSPVTDPNQKQTTYSYDGVYRLEIERDPLLHPTTYGYDLDGNRTSLIDADLVETRYEYDALARLTAVVENYRQGIPADLRNQRPDGVRLRRRPGTACPSSTATTIRRTSPTTTWAASRPRATPSATRRPTATTRPATASRSSTPTALRRPSSATTTCTGLTSIDYPAPDADVSFTYDAGRQPDDMTDGLGSTHWVYDDLGRPTSVTDPFNGTVGYGYDGVGNRTSLDYPGATPPISYAYDDASPPPDGHRLGLPPHHLRFRQGRAPWRGRPPQRHCLHLLRMTTPAG